MTVEESLISQTVSSLGMSPGHKAQTHLMGHISVFAETLLLRYIAVLPAVYWIPSRGRIFLLLYFSSHY